MFIIELTYRVELTKIDELLNDHIAYLNEQYAAGHFEVSGRKIPRTGGIIISNVATRQKLDEILQKDPFHVHKLADYTVTEFVPSMTSKAFNFLIS